MKRKREGARQEVTKDRKTDINKISTKISERVVQMQHSNYCTTGNRNLSRKAELSQSVYIFNNDKRKTLQKKKSHLVYQSPVLGPVKNSS